MIEAFCTPRIACPFFKDNRYALFDQIMRSLIISIAIHSIKKTTINVENGVFNLISFDLIVYFWHTSMQTDWKFMISSAFDALSAK